MRWCVVARAEGSWGEAEVARTLAAGAPLIAPRVIWVVAGWRTRPPVGLLLRPSPAQRLRVSESETRPNDTSNS